jgi:hypothetical protein
LNINQRQNDYSCSAVHFFSIDNVLLSSGKDVRLHFLSLSKFIFLYYPQNFGNLDLMQKSSLLWKSAPPETLIMAVRKASNNKMSDEQQRSIMAACNE